MLRRLDGEGGTTGPGADEARTAGIQKDGQVKDEEFAEFKNLPKSAQRQRDVKGQKRLEGKQGGDC